MPPLKASPKRRAPSSASSPKETWTLLSASSPRGAWTFASRLRTCPHPKPTGRAASHFLRPSSSPSFPAAPKERDLPSPGLWTSAHPHGLVSPSHPHPRKPPALRQSPGAFESSPAPSAAWSTGVPPVVSRVLAGNRSHTPQPPPAPTTSPPPILLILKSCQSCPKKPPPTLAPRTNHPPLAPRPPTFFPT
jgi:hypothetical protein